MREPDPEVVAELARKVSLLIENLELRLKLGRAVLREVEEGQVFPDGDERKAAEDFR
jgi:hypothetical protein